MAQTNEPLPRWIPKAHRLIAAMALASYRQTNTAPDGHAYRRHHPYTVPTLAQALVRALGQQDEAGAKAIFLQLNDVPELARD